LIPTTIAATDATTDAADQGSGSPDTITELIISRAKSRTERIS
jgi:hypothetical protein